MTDNDFDPNGYQNPAHIQQALQCSTIAVVGLSGNPARPSHDVASYMQAHGYTIVPVNPMESSILGEQSYPDLQSIPFKVDLVNVFRDSSAVPGIVDAVIELSLPILWLQLGVIHPQAIQRAERAGIICIVDRCIKIEHRRPTAA